MTANQNEFDSPRKIRLEEAASGAELYKICFGGDMGDEDESARPTRRGGWYVITRRGQVVSQLGLSHSQVELYGSRLRIGSIGGVSTHPDYREQGLAGRLLAHSAHVFAEEGARLMLISGGRGLYTRLGNVPAMRLAGYTLKAAPHPSPLTPGVIIRSLDTADLQTCARLYHSEPVRFVRRPEEFNGALHYNRGWLIEQDDAPRAYLLLFTPWEYMDGPEQGVREVTEYAGSRLALVEGMRQALSGVNPLQPPIHELRLSVPWQDVDFLQLLDGFSQPLGMVNLHWHTMRLVNFPGLRHDLAGYIQARLPKELRRGLRFEQSGPLQADPQLGPTSDGRMAITWEGSRKGVERLELSSAEMTALVMGSCSPLPALRGALGEIVPALFPLPSFLPGINYR